MTSEAISHRAPNDFAYWITGIWAKKREPGGVGYGIDTIQYTSARELRTRSFITIENYIVNTDLL